jgi:hypothetical protein
MTMPGIAAVQGLNVRPEDAEQNDGINRVVPAEQIVAAATPPSDAALNDLELAAQRANATKATYFHNDSVGSKQAEYRRLRSEISEELAATNVTGGIRADPFSVGGNNFPNYDVLGDQEVSSVKVHSYDEGEPRSAYQKDFQQIVNPNSAGNQQAAARLLEIKENQPQAWKQLSPHLPANVREATDQKALQTALAERATLRIPQDQVESVRKDLRACMSANPNKYGLDAQATPEVLAPHIEQMVQTRVLPIDERYATSHYQAKAAELVDARDVSIEARSNEREQDYSYSPGYS